MSAGSESRAVYYYIDIINIRSYTMGRKRKELDRETLYDLYVRQHKTLEEIGDIFKVVPGTVKNRVKEFGFARYENVVNGVVIKRA